MSSAISDFIRDLNFESFLWDLNQGGWFEFVFPFLLVYALVFTITDKIDIIKEKKPVRVIVALVFALFAIAFPITGEGSGYGPGQGQTLGDLMMTMFPGVTAFSIAVLALYIVVAMLGIDLMRFFGEKEDQNKILKYILGGLGFLVVLYYFGLGFEWWSPNSSGELSWLFDILEDPLLYILILFGLFFWWVTKDDGDSKPPKSED